MNATCPVCIARTLGEHDLEPRQCGPDGHSLHHYIDCSCLGMGSTQAGSIEEATDTGRHH